MPGISGEVIVAIALAVLVVVIARHLWKSHKGGGCCGEREPAETKVRVADRNRSHYP